jgi:oligoribonuclease NrnB/cAMP/cGMP phosphodiesterase (DHH superfamily)
MKDIVVLYHFPCLDGFTSAWVARRALGDTADYIPADYSMPFPAEDFADKTVYFVDYSFKREKMLEVARVAKQIIVLDHHKTAIEDLAELYEQGVITGVFDLHRSGAGIVWDYFFPDDPRPALVNYVEDRDLWRFALPHSKEINQALFSYDYDFDTWDKLEAVCGAQPEMITFEGTAIWRKHMKDVRELAKHSRLMNIAGQIVPVVNANYTYGSEIGSLLSEDAPFAGYYWIGADGRFNFGLRSRHDGGADVGAIAALYGGGGHRTAAGFSVASLKELWMNKEED